MAASQVPALPYSWPFSGDLRPERTCLMIIDMQASRMLASGASSRQPQLRPCFCSRLRRPTASASASAGSCVKSVK
jgi:hypothetical protein